ncbi:MAG: lipid-A-disaccharide synthase [Xanthomonadales bacterium]|nr:lipid-A-disaccharide synthase [Xanthomonadales bacterium]
MSQSAEPAHATPTIALIAGEDSGDALGADLISALRQRYPQARILGIGGPRMAAVGFEAWHNISELSVMGLAEVVRHLPRLLRLRRQLGNRLLALRPDIVIGIDAPDFNLGLEKRLKRAGITSVHYVSPSVWAWRERRALKLGDSADRVLCLLPMEPPIYARFGVDARFVGHPLATQFAQQPDRAHARKALDLPEDAPVLAVLPGSRGSEIGMLGTIFLDAAQRVASAIPGLRIVIPAANERCRALLEAQLAQSMWAGAQVQISRPTLLDGHARDALIAADLVLVASGTAALETMLAKRPMVVAYRIAPLTYRLIRALRMMKTSVYSLPNVLAGRALVTEMMQADCTAEALAQALLALYADQPQRDAMVAEFGRLHTQLLGGLDGNPADHAAAAIAELLDASHASA